MTSGKYMYDIKTKKFYPAKGRYDTSEVIRMNKQANSLNENINVNFHPSSLGLSMGRLSWIFSEPDLQIDIIKYENNIEITFKNSLDGDIADFLYLEFPNMKINYGYASYNAYHIGNMSYSDKKSFWADHFLKKIYNIGMQVKIEWFDDDNNPHCMYANMGQGKLLIPLGAGRQWLLNNHSKLKISVLQDGEKIKTPDIAKIQFLKLREVN